MSTYRRLILVLVTFLLIITISPAYSEYSPYQKSSLLEQGKVFYDAGKFAAGAQTWEQAVKVFKQTGEQRSQALTYNYLAIVYQDLGKWDAAQKAIAQAQNLLKVVNDSLLYAQVLNTQGSFQFNRGNSEAALETWSQAEKRYRSLLDGLLGSDAIYMVSTSIYSQHLRGLLNLLIAEPQLMSAMHQLVTSDETVELDAITGYKLESMGLVQLDANEACISCELYRFYFQKELEKLDEGVSFIKAPPEHLRTRATKIRAFDYMMSNCIK